MNGSASSVRERVVAVEASEEVGVLLGQRLAEQEVSDDDLDPLAGTERLRSAARELVGDKLFEWLGRLADGSSRGTPGLRTQAVLLRHEFAEAELVGLALGEVDESLQADVLVRPDRPTGLVPTVAMPVSGQADSHMINGNGFGSH
ncbi:hypothetical protein [Streptomyces canus]|uniref:hypothetical protein n=1 Tax=Streptomyces canus TaxID=58343 RepID=UPI002DDB01DA|nr:hypothetical protein [Streptomyces canus]WSD91691.1 hypothetical protein OG925_48670 [Streptomyces canus]